MMSPAFCVLSVHGLAFFFFFAAIDGGGHADKRTKPLCTHLVSSGAPLISNS